MTRQHGTRSRYVRGPDENDQPGKGCRCEPCRTANNAESNRVNRLKAYGQWRPYVDAEPVRQHVRELGLRGLGPKRVAELAGVSFPTVARLMYGEPWRNTPPSCRVRVATADAILAVTSGEPRGGTRIDGAGTRRRLRALVAVGWTLSNLARTYGMNRSSLAVWIHADNVWAGTADKVRAMYDQAWDTPPPLHSAKDRVASERAKAWAARNKWPRPAEWDDDLIDIPDDELATELARQASLMTDEELVGCHTFRYKHGDLSPLTVAGALEYARRRNARQKAKAAAA